MPDPAADSSRGPQGLNRYAYVAGDPINRIDPKGLQFEFLNPFPYGNCLPFPINTFVSVDGIDSTPLDTLCNSGHMAQHCREAGNCGETIVFLPPPPPSCDPVISSFRVIAICDGSTPTESSVTIGSRYGGSQVAASEVVSVATDNELFIEFVGSYEKNPLISNSYYQVFKAHKPTLGKPSFPTTGNIIWNVRFTCYGGGTGHRRLTQGVSCSK